MLLRKYNSVKNRCNESLTLLKGVNEILPVFSYIFFLFELYEIRRCIYRTLLIVVSFVKSHALFGGLYGFLSSHIFLSDLGDSMPVSRSVHILVSSLWP